MCGIAGFCLSPGERLDATNLSMCLFEQIVERGEHATGAAWVFTEKNKKAGIAVSKAPVPAWDFEQYLANMPTTTKRAILHTRWATQGSPQNNLNNHPIVSGRIVGVHNGHLANDKEIFDKLLCVRNGEVDSEAAFALLDNTIYEPSEVLESLKGRAALAWFDARDKRDLHVARVTDSPLAIGTTADGSFIFASTVPLLAKACDEARVQLEWIENVKPYTYMRIRNGLIQDVRPIGASLKAIA